jgi:metallo-beta-lactamase class B
VAAARAAAGTVHPVLFDRLCAPNVLNPPPRPANTGAAKGPRPTPSRDTWHVEPAKVFDNLYFVGEKEYSAWAVTTSEGIIIIDAIFDYSVEDQVINGLTKLGLDPKQVKYVIISHAHYDHVGGAFLLQEKLGAKVIMSAADWDLLERTTGAWRKPRRDMVATDGMKLTLGGTTLELHITPGHTPGTVSTIIPVFDKGVRHTAAYWGGTLFNFARSPEAFDTYIASANKFRQIADRAGADIVLSNHTEYDGSKLKIPALAARKAADPHPYVIGHQAALNYLNVARECAEAAKLSLR